MRINIGKKKKEYCMLSLVFFIILLGHSFVGLYHDDYGYASLSYGYSVEGVNGLQFSLREILTYLKWHYTSWGGRVLYFFFEIVFLKFGIKAFMITQSFIITFIIYFTYKIIDYYTKELKSIYILLFLLSMYMLFPLNIFNNGIYWATASVLYLWPLLPCIAGIYFFTRAYYSWNQEDKNYKLYNTIMPVCFLLATFSQEQVGALTIIYLICFIILTQRNNLRKYMKINLRALVPSILGYALLMLAPGNYSRMNIHENLTEQISFFEKIMQRINIIYHNLAQQENRIYHIVLFICVYWFFRKNFKLIREKNRKLLDVILEEKNIAILAIVVASIGSQVMMIFSPSLPTRMQLVMWIPMFIFMGIVFGEMLNTIRRVIPEITIICLLVLGVFNYTKITVGYAKNYSILINNDKLLKEYSKNQEYLVGQEIILAKLLDDEYAGSMPYHESTAYIEPWIKEYYNIPMDVELKWLSSKQMNFNPTITSVYPQVIYINDGEDVAIGVVAEYLDKSTVILVEGQEIGTTYSSEFVSAVIPNELLRDKDSIGIALKWNEFDTSSQYIDIAIQHQK